MKLSVIIVNYNHKKYLKTCLNSLLKNLKGITFEVFLIDNNSKDGSVGFLKQKASKKIKIILNKKNLGFARACNQGIRRAKGDYILLINPDIKVLKESVGKMIDFLERNRGLGCVAPKLLNPDQSLQYSIRRFPNVLTVLIRRTPLRLLPFIKNKDALHLMKNVNHNRIIKIDWALASCLMVKRKVFDQIGLFDENFFVYCEDIDWFYRLKKAGLGAYYLPEAKVIHHHLAKSDKKLLSKESLYHTKSMIYFFKKYWREILTFKYP